MKQAWESMVAYKLVWLRVIFYFLMPMGRAFVLACQVDDMDAKWATMGHFAKAVFFILIVTAGCDAVVALVDNSYQRTKTEVEKKKQTGDTAIMYKDAGIS